MKNRPAESTLPAREGELTTDEIAAYLELHPEFFDGRDDLLLQLAIPHARGNSISLVERQVALLRERNRGLKSELDKLITAAKDNDATFLKSRKLVLSLLDATSGSELLDHLEKCLTKEFKCELYRLFIYGDVEHHINDWASVQPRAGLKREIGGLISSRKPVLGVLRDSESQFLFGAASGEIGSTGIFPIRKSGDIALLALGSSNTTHFQSGMGTLFTDFISDTLARLIPRFTYR